jgi:hypothetical protein
MTTITIIDESTLSQKRTWTLEILEESLSLRELIRSRIYQEVIEFNAKQSPYFQGLVQPTGAESSLNGYRFKSAQTINWQAQYKKAIEAFQRRGYIVLIDDQQADVLDTQITLHPGSEVTFFKLVPLVGG